MMDAILGDLPYCFVYLDDILVFSNTPEEHLQHLETIFEILSENGLVVNRPKCVLGQTQLEFLGYSVDKDGVKPLEDRVQAIRDVTPPTTVKELQRFLGMLNYYRRFIPKAAQHLFHLFNALKGKPKNLLWTTEMNNSFIAVKEALASAVMLRHPRPDAPIAITSDASKEAIGAVLEQRGPEGWEPLSFFSAKLLPNQQLWPPFDRELLAAFRSIRHFRHMVEGRSFTLYTDHQSLVPSLNKKTEPQTARQTYQLAGIAEFTTDIRYLEGRANSVADALSRPNALTSSSANTGAPSNTTPRDGTPTNRPNKSSAQPDTTPRDGTPINRPNASSAQPDTTTGDGTPTNRPNTSSEQPDGTSSPVNTSSAKPSPVPTSKTEDLVAVVAAVEPLGLDLKAMALEQPLDADFIRLSNDARSGLTFRRVDLGNASILVDVSNGPARPFVPFSWRKRVFNAIHTLGHPGVDRTRQIVAAKFVWPSLRADCSKWARECIECQRAKVGRNVVPEIGHFEVPKRRFEHIHADIAMVPTSNGYSYLLTIIDHFSRWPTAIPLRNITTESVIDAFAHGWFASFGIPNDITTDRGSQFNSAIWNQLLRIWGVSHHQTTAYHPEANGLVERFHRRLKESLITLCKDERDKWYWRLPCSLLAIRTAIKQDIGASSADLVYGEGLALPGELLGTQPAEDQNLQILRERQLANLRLEVERLQPTATSAHRTPIVHLPDSLATATHVFVRRGGVQPPLMAPYEGPFRVASRSPSGFEIFRPGRGVEKVALNRLKPAHTTVDDDVEQQDLDEEIPPPPPRRGRPSAPQSRQPPSSTRVPRQARPTQQSDATAREGEHDGASTSNPSAPTRQRGQRVRNIDEFLPPPPRPAATIPSADNTTTSTAPNPAPAAAPTPVPGAPSSLPFDPRRQPEDASLSFDDYLDHRRPRPDVSAIAALMKKHLSDTKPLEDDSPVSPGSPSGGRVGMRPFYSDS